MKKLIALILVICLAFAVYAGLSKTYSAEYTFTSKKGEVDYAKIYKLHSPDEVVAEIDGKDVKWEDLFYTYYSYAKSTEEYINQVNTYYGAEIGWEDMEKVSGSGESFSDGLKEYAQSILAQYSTIEKYCSEHGISIGDADKKKLDENLQTNIASICGEGATEEDFNKTLEEMYIPRGLYDRMMQDSILSEKVFDESYGKNDEKLDDAEVTAEIKDMGYMHAGHILLSVINPETGETADETTVNEKKRQAEDLSKYLNDITDKNERYQEFLKKAEELTDDGSIEYTFRSGYMVEDFENAVKDLEEYQVSEPVKTVYGYHVIIKLPIDPNATLMDQGISGKSFCAQEKVSSELNQIYEGMELKFVEDFNIPKITRYING